MHQRLYRSRGGSRVDWRRCGSLRVSPRSPVARPRPRRVCRTPSTARLGRASWREFRVGTPDRSWSCVAHSMPADCGTNSTTLRFPADRTSSSLASGRFASYTAAFGIAMLPVRGQRRRRPTGRIGSGSSRRMCAAIGNIGRRCWRPVGALGSSGSARCARGAG